MALHLRLCEIADETNAYNWLVIEKDVPVGRIYLAATRTPQRWVWTVTAHQGHGANGAADSFEEAKAALRAAWEKISPHR